MHLYEQIAKGVDEWRRKRYPCEEYQVITEILDWAGNPDGEGFRLRRAQMRALETYWYVRLIEGTPHVFDLYQKAFTTRADLISALGVPPPAFEQADYDIEALWQKVKTEDNFVRQFKLEALRETLTLDYPSYILALAMGAGKTVLIGAIFATEFAMALEYPDGPFVQNALVFAPGKTIIESLRELAETPYNRILPPRHYKPFAASFKLTFTRDGERDIPVIRRSAFNVVVTNTEKIRIQKETIRKSDIGRLFYDREDEAKTEVANLRLQAIASLPNLAIFSDEAHHTYGLSLGAELKKVRKTVDYLAQNTNVLCVVNTTGTPYFERQPLRDVVFWYGLSEGIHDGILKEVGGNIQGFHFENNVETYVAHVIEDFFQEYGTVALPDGTPAKLAMYFPQTEDVQALRPVIEAKLAELGLSPTLIVEHHTAHEMKADFDRFKFKDSPHRIALLVDRGVEGWDVPALFACSLARRLRSSNNFVLQAACRCLRQVPGNRKHARIYLSMDNYHILDRQLQETYGENVSDLYPVVNRTLHATIRLRKLHLPPLVVRQTVRTVVRTGPASGRAVRLNRPKASKAATMERIVYTVSQQRTTQSILEQVGDTLEISVAPQTADLYTAAVDLAAVYRLDLWTLYDELRRVYHLETEIPVADFGALARQVEDQTRNYEVREEIVELALALVKPDGFQKAVDDDGQEVYTAEISYPLDKEKLLVSWGQMKEKNPGDFGLHYDPYNFDSAPEANFFEQLLSHFNLHPQQVEDIYFTGALTSPDKTDFLVDYKGDDGQWHSYSPDFIIRRKDGKCLIVEIKNAQFESATREDIDRAARGQVAIHTEGRKAMALKAWERLNPDRLRYEIIFVKDTPIPPDQTKRAKRFVEEPDP